MSKTWKLILATVLILVPGYLIRYNETIYIWFYNKLTTYPGDLWNFFANYLSKGLVYPPEYPTGLRFFYEIFGFYKYQNYTIFFTVNAIVITIFACATTYLLYKILQRNKKQETNKQNIIWFWILAPSFIFYSFLNYDIPVVFFIVLAVYLFLRKKYSWAIISLALGVVVKVFPVFLLPIFILKSPRKQWLKLIIFFVGIILLLNFPYMIKDFNSWIFPYTWQIGQNLSRSPESGTYWWIFYKYLGNNTGWFSLFLFLGLYIFTYIKLKKSSFVNLCIAVILLFLLTDRIYSPQYNLYLLPFLVLASYKIDKKLFYLLEIPNALQLIFLFYLKENVIYLQLIILLKYIAITGLYLKNYKNSLAYSKKLK